MWALSLLNSPPFEPSCGQFTEVWGELCPAVDFDTPGAASGLVDVDGRLLLIENEQIVVVNGYQGKVIAIDIASGRPLWAKDNSSYVGAAEALGNIYVVDAEGGVSAIAEGGQSIVWTQTVLARRRLTEPAALSGVVAVGDFDGYLHLLGQLDGQLIGRTRVDSDGLRAPMAVDGKLLYVYGNSGKLVAYKVTDR